MEEIDLSDLFTTKSQSIDFASRLSIVNKKIFETGFNPETALLEQFGIGKKDTFMTLLRDNKVNAESRLSIKEFIDKILQKIQLMPVLSMTLAFEPTEDTLKSLSRWILLNTKKHMVFDIKVDEEVIGGAAIQSNGKYYDYSIRPEFERVFTDYFPKPAGAKAAPAKSG